MSVSINFKPSSNEDKWKTLKSGDFVFLENSTEHPIPIGLYRVFIIVGEEEPHDKNIFIVPMYDGDFGNMFPYMVNTPPYPVMKHKVDHINIDVETPQ